MNEITTSSPAIAKPPVVGSTDNNIMPASFGVRGDRSKLQTTCIVNLLKTGINDCRVISRSDIVDCYVDYKFHNIEVLEMREWDCWQKKEVLNRYTRETFRKQKCYEPTVIAWFKNNLGSAILKGRILAIPVIELEG